LAALEGFTYLVLELSQGSFIFSGIIMAITMFVSVFIAKPIQYVNTLVTLCLYHNSRPMSMPGSQKTATKPLLSWAQQRNLTHTHPAPCV